MVCSEIALVNAHLDRIELSTGIRGRRRPEKIWSDSNFSESSGLLDQMFFDGRKKVVCQRMSYCCRLMGQVG